MGHENAKAIGAAVLAGLFGMLVWVAAAILWGGNLHLIMGFLLPLFLFFGYWKGQGAYGGSFFVALLLLLFFFGALALFSALGINLLQAAGVQSFSDLQLIVSAQFKGNFFALWVNAIKTVSENFVSLWNYWVTAAFFEGAGVLYSIRLAAKKLPENKRSI